MMTQIICRENRETQSHTDTQTNRERKCVHRFNNTRTHRRTNQWKYLRFRWLLFRCLLNIWQVKIAQLDSFTSLRSMINTSTIFIISFFFLVYLFLLVSYYLFCALMHAVDHLMTSAILALLIRWCKLIKRRVDAFFFNCNLTSFK